MNPTVPYNFIFGSPYDDSIPKIDKLKERLELLKTKGSVKFDKSVLDSCIEIFESAIETYLVTKNKRILIFLTPGQVQCARFDIFNHTVKDTGMFGDVFIIIHPFNYDCYFYADQSERINYDDFHYLHDAWKVLNSLTDVQIQVISTKIYTTYHLTDDNDFTNLVKDFLKTLNSTNRRFKVRQLAMFYPIIMEHA